MNTCCETENKTHNSDTAKLLIVKELVKQKNIIMQQRIDIENQFRNIITSIHKLCPHGNIVPERIHDGHTSHTYYHCNICQNNVSYCEYQNYLLRNNI